MKHLVCALVAFVATAQTTAPPLREVIEQALKRNKDVLALEQRIREAQGFLRQAGVRPAPSIEVSGATGRPLRTVGEEEYSAGYVLPIEPSAKRDSRVRVAQLGLSVAEAEVAERVRQLAFDIKSHYFEATAEKRKAQALERLMTLTQESLRLTEARVREGDAAALDRDLLRVELSRTDAQRQMFLGRAQATFLELSQLLGTEPPAVLSDPVLPSTAPELAALQQHAIANRPDLRKTRLEEEQARAGIQLAEAEAKPNLQVAARYSRRNARFDDQLGVTSTGATTQLRDRDDILTLGVLISLQGRRRNLGNIEAASARSASARLRREYLESIIPLEAAAALRRYEATSRALSMLDRGVLQQSEKNLAVIRQAYQLGQLRLLDVLAEQRRLIETQLNYIDTQLELARALFELERAAGGNLP